MEEIWPGREFLHARFIEGDKQPARCVVTSMRDGEVFYRAYVEPGERGKASHHARLEYFLTVVKEWLD